MFFIIITVILIIFIPVIITNKLSDQSRWDWTLYQMYIIIIIIIIIIITTTPTPTTIIIITQFDLTRQNP